MNGMGCIMIYGIARCVERKGKSIGPGVEHWFEEGESGSIHGGGGVYADCEKAIVKSTLRQSR